VYTCLKRIMIIVLCLVLLSPLSADLKVQAASPSVTVSAPDVKTGEDFVISVTITATSTPIRVIEVAALLYSADIFIESQFPHRTVSANSSTHVNLVGRASAPGLHRVGIEVRFEDEELLPPQREVMIIEREVMINVTDPAGRAPRPRFEVSGVSFNPAVPDITKPFTLNIDLRNIGNEPARDMVAAFVGGANFSVTTLTNRVQTALVDRGQTTTVSFQIRARDTHASNEITLNLNYGEHTQTEVLNLPLPDVSELPKPDPPNVKISSFDIRPSGEDRLKLSLSVQNTGEEDAENIRISLAGGDKIFPLGTSSIRRIFSLSSGASSMIEYILSPRGALTNHPLDITIEYTDPEGEKITENEKIFISFNLEPKLRITGFSVSPRRNEGEFLLNFELSNHGASAAKDIALRFTGANVFPLAASNLIQLADLTQGEQKAVSLTMKAGAKSEVYTVPIEITYTSSGGYEHKETETITLTAESIGIVPEDEEEKKGTPRVMLERHTLSEEQIFAGSSFTLALYIRNNAERSVGNMKISLGSIQVTGTGAGGAGGGSGGTVFSPLDGSSSSFFVEEIEAKAQLVKEVTLFVDPSAAAMTYTLPISLEFEDEEGNSFSVNETVNIPVLQETRVQVLSVDIPTSAAAGQPVPLSMEFANTGRIALNNVFVEIVGDFPKENATYFVPRLEIGMSDFFQGMIIPSEEGTISGSLTLTYLDALNQEVKIEHPFTMTVEPMMDMPVDMPLEPMPGMGTPQVGLPWIMIAIIGGGVIILLIAAIFIIKKIRAKRQNDFFNEKA